MMNRLRVSERDDDLFSNEGEDTEENYINKKQLIHLENDKSVTIDDSLGDEDGFTNRRSITPSAFTKKRSMNINPHEELLKFISDTSDIYLDNTPNGNMIQNNIKNEGRSAYSNNEFNRNSNSNNAQVHSLSTNRFEVFFPGTTPGHRRTNSANLEKERFFTLQQSQSHSQNQSQSSFRTSNNYKEKFEFMESKYKDLSVNYNNLVEMVKEWQMFYIKIFNSLSIPIPTDDTFNAIFSDKYKADVIRLVEMMTNKIGDMEDKIRKMQFEINEKEAKIGDMEEKNRKIQFEIDERDAKIGNKIKEILVVNLTNFSIDGIIPKSHLLPTKPSPKNIKVSDEYFNSLAPFSTKNLTQKKKEAKERDTTLVVSRDNFGLISDKKIKLKEKVNVNEKKNEKLEKMCTQDFYFIHNPSPKSLKRFTELGVQTSLNKFEFDKLIALNEEYSQQLVHYQKEKYEIEEYYNREMEKLREEIIKTKSEKKALATHNFDLPPHPEMIPPEQTLKIFLHCIRHFKYEDEMYKKYVNTEDLQSIKSFLFKSEKFIEKDKSKSVPKFGIYPENNEKTIKYKETKKFINDGALSSSIKKVTSYENLNPLQRTSNDNQIYSKYKTMLKNITSKKKSNIK